MQPELDISGEYLEGVRSAVGGLQSFAVVALGHPARMYTPPSVDSHQLGAGREIRIKERGHVITDVSGFRGAIRCDPRTPDGLPRRCLAVLRAEREFGCRAETSFDKGPRRTIEW